MRIGYKQWIDDEENKESIWSQRIWFLIQMLSSWDYVVEGTKCTALCCCESTPCNDRSLQDCIYEIRHKQNTDVKPIKITEISFIDHFMTQSTTQLPSQYSYHDILLLISQYTQCLCWYLWESIKTEQEVQSDHLLQFSILILFPTRNGKIHNESNIHNKCTHSIHNH